MHTIEVVLASVLICYSAGALLNIWGIIKGQGNILKTALVVSSLGCLLHLAVLVIRIIISGRLPLTNGLEFLLTFTWITVLLYLIFAVCCQFNAAGGIVMIIAAILVFLALLLMGNQLTAAGPLMPALKSPWLAVHVITAAIAYAAFALAAGMAVMQFFNAGQGIREEHLYITVGGGFALLSLSIILGAIWAEQAWGKYWSWDPKETWALVTWIIYALYLHLHRSRDWQGINVRLMVIAGFILVLFTFLGVNYLLPGLHSYA